MFGIAKQATFLANPYLGPPTVDYMLIGGGGSGGVNSAGGGGAGQYLTANSFSISKDTTYTVTVGGGAVGGTQPSWGYSGYKGTSSTFATVIAKGGGGGVVQIFTEAANSYPGRDVGNLGGYISNTTWTFSYAQNTGGTGYSGSYAKAGGGGGAGGAGSNGTSVKGGDGGTGVTITFTGASLSIGGGGGGCGDSRNNGIGNGATTFGATSGTNGTPSTAAGANTGAGSGAVGYISTGSNTYPFSGNGGSGRVSIRFSNTYSTSTAVVTGTYTYANTGGYHIFNWTQSGTFMI